MPEILIPSPEIPDIYSFGFNKELYRQTEEDTLGQESNELFYNSLSDAIASSQISKSQLLDILEVGGFDVINTFAYGDGSDGDVILNTTTTLTRDMYYDNLTVLSGIILNTGGYKIYCKTRLLNKGTIRNNGSQGSSLKTGGVGATGKTVRGGANGGDGATGGTSANYGGPGGGGGGVVFISTKIIDNSLGTIEANGGNGLDGATTQCDSAVSGAAGSSISVGKGGDGAVGGTTGSGGGGAGGAVTTPSFQNFSNYFAGVNVFDYVVKEGIGGGGGGGGGGKDCNNTALGGGGGGGHVLIYYRKTTWGLEQAVGGTGNVTGSSGTVTKIQL